MTCGNSIDTINQLLNSSKCIPDLFLLFLRRTYMFTKKNSVLMLAVIAAMSACGGGGSSSTPVATTPPVTTPPVTTTPPVVVTPSSGKAVDGYLAGSTVFCDINKDGVASTGEATTTTDANGGFTFASGCAGTIVVAGGKDATTGFAFAGTLKSPAGSTMATPLTSLLADSTMTAAQLAKSLNVPTTTDVTKVDPADGKNNDLLRTTLATQQIMQQLANTIAKLAGSTDTAGMYSKVAGALSSTLVANPAPLFSADGSINQTTLNAAAKSSVAAAAADPKLAKFTISDADLYAASAQISAQATSFLTATDADLVSLTTRLQDPAAAPIETAASVNYLALTGDAVRINGNAISYAALKSGATISSPTSLGLDFSIKGTPVINTVVALGLELKEAGTNGRTLQMIIDKVTVTVKDGKLSIVPVTTAKVYVYGHTATGSDINLTINDLTFKPLTVTNNSLTLNYTALVNKVLASVDNSTKTTAEKFTNITGNFGIKVAFSGLPVRTVDGTASLGASTVAITTVNPTQTVMGLGVSGTLNIQ